jgi:hypothetical protein
MAASISPSFNTVEDAFLFLCEFSPRVNINPKNLKNDKLQEAIQIIAKHIFEVKPEDFKNISSAALEERVINICLQDHAFDEIQAYTSSSRCSDLFQGVLGDEIKDLQRVQSQVVKALYSFDEKTRALIIEGSLLKRPYFLELLRLIPPEIKKSAATLCIKDSYKLPEISPRDFEEFVSLESLEIRNCSDLTTFADKDPDFKGQESVRRITLINDHKLKDYQGVGTYHNLESFSAIDMVNIRSLKPLNFLKLKHLEVRGCHHLFHPKTFDADFVKELNELQKSLEELTLTDLPSFYNIKALENFPDLKLLDISNIGEKKLDNIPRFPNLVKLITDTEQSIGPDKVPPHCGIVQVPRRK